MANSTEHFARDIPSCGSARSIDARGVTMLLIAISRVAFRVRWWSLPRIRTPR